MALTQQQQKALDLVKSGKNIFITGKAGTGKSFVIKEIKKELGDKLTICSSTGVSAIQIEGTTIHSLFSLRVLDEPKEDIYKRLKQPYSLEKFEEIKYIHTLLIDEVSMLSEKVLVYVDYLLRKVRNVDLPCGGVQMIFVGDFLQLPKLDKQENEIKNSKIWQQQLEVQEIYLNEVVRQKDEKFIMFLEKVRNRTIDRELHEMFKELEKNQLQDPIMLMSSNAKAKEENDKKVNELKTLEKTFPMQILFSKSDWELKDFLKILLAQQELLLKEEMRVMLIRNLDIEKGLVNGAIGTVIDLKSGIPIVRFDNGEERAIHYEKFLKEQHNPKTKRMDKIVEVSQIPLIHAYALTIHKSQGLTLEKAKVDLQGSFETGQAYTAVSRVKEWKNLQVINYQSRFIITNESMVEYYKSLEQNIE